MEESLTFKQRYVIVPFDELILILKHGTITGIMALSPDKKYYYVHRGIYLERIESNDIDKNYPQYTTIFKDVFLKNIFNKLRKNKIKKIINKYYEDWL